MYVHLKEKVIENDGLFSEREALHLSGINTLRFSHTLSSANRYFLQTERVVVRLRRRRVVLFPN